MVYTIYRLINIAFDVYIWLIIIRALLSWIAVPKRKALRVLFEFVYEVTEPFLKLIRRLIPLPVVSGVAIDFSPFIAILLLELARRFVLTLLRQFF